MANAKLLIVLALQLASMVAAEDTTMQLMESKLARTMDDLNRGGTVKIYGDMITLEKVDVEEDAEVGRASEDPLVSRIEKFLRTRRINIHFPTDGSSADFFGRALGQKDVGVELRGLTKGASEGGFSFKQVEI